MKYLFCSARTRAARDERGSERDALRSTAIWAGRTALRWRTHNEAHAGDRRRRRDELGLLHGSARAVGTPNAHSRKTRVNARKGRARAALPAALGNGLSRAAGR